MNKLLILSLLPGAGVHLDPGVGVEPAGPHRHHQGDPDLLPGQGPVVRAQRPRRAPGQKLSLNSTFKLTLFYVGCTTSGWSIS